MKFPLEKFANAIQSYIAVRSLVYNNVEGSNHGMAIDGMLKDPICFNSKRYGALKLDLTKLSLTIPWLTIHLRNRTNCHDFSS